MSASFTQERGQLTISIENVERSKGSMYVAIYDDAARFLEDGANPYGKIIPLTKASNCTVTFDDLPFGQYAIAVFHDQNENGKLDRNLFGIPTEPYAFSNNPTVKWSSPTFAEASIKFGESRKNIRVELRRWKNH